MHFRIMPGSWLILVLAVSSAAVLAHAATVEHTFNVATLCWPRISQPGDVSITAVDGVPGPVIEAYEGDTVVVHVINDSPHNVTIHWHGVIQRGTPWADGPEMVTQCPIRPGTRYTYRFNVSGQEGTLWWHAHASFLRATVHGALIIRPRAGAGAYPFPTPDGEAVVLLGEWWNDENAISSNVIADAYTINGKPGDLYAGETTANRSAKFEVTRNSTYLLRIINAALNTAFFFKVAGHTFTVVAADASYTTSYETDVIVIAPGQTVDALMAADASPGCYYMAISSYQSAFPPPPGGFNGNVTTSLVEYAGAAAPGGGQQAPALPDTPEPTDTDTANRFYTGLTALVRPGMPRVPLTVDTRMFVTVGLGLRYPPCEPTQTTPCQPIPVATMNNQSFVLPSAMSMLDARYRNTPDGVYTRDFPDRPPVEFDYTNRTEMVVGGSAAALLFPGMPATKVRKLEYNATVEMVLQNTALVGRESHPMHLHGFDFFVLAQGFGNYDDATGSQQFNLRNPQERNTIAVPTGGWAVIRFVADNPGMWFMHCHIDSHLSIGLGMVFEVEDGPTPDTKLPPPPADLPQC
ncbi:hypothetical protein SEVIR_5G388000v4 [Setaria viridis]|uniref:Laccase n=2 Tax=Setaria viridis TaxID=4556 RepID=A0A4U6URI9_SETVI|nr:laccase-6-like [Setaria viridis]TKW17744.1 hypothetical protein SEVIR_5G388000v2 [Setaria viridis]